MSLRPELFTHQDSQKSLLNMFYTNSKNTGNAELMFQDAEALKELAKILMEEAEREKQKKDGGTELGMGSATIVELKPIRDLLKKYIPDQYRLNTFTLEKEDIYEYVITSVQTNVKPSELLRHIWECIVEENGKKKRLPYKTVCKVAGVEPRSWYSSSAYDTAWRNLSSNNH